LQWVMMYNNYYQTEAKKYGFELLNVDNIDDFEV